MTSLIEVAGFTIGESSRPLLIAGPCVIESADGALRLAESISSLPQLSAFNFVFKASYAKDNRSSGESYRGPGLDAGLEVLARIKKQVGCPVLSDVHGAEEVGAAAEVLDIIQIPAFLCRQTSLIEAAAACDRAINVKKGQFLAPEDMHNVVDKLRGAGAGRILLTERGTTFGYHDLVVDFRSFPRMRKTGCPVVFDVTHSLQRPGGLGSASGGEPALAGMMARAAAAVPCDGLFIETHPSPKDALSDAASMLPLDRLGELLAQTSRIFELSRSFGGAGADVI